MRQLLRSLAALGLMYAAGAVVGAAEQALRDPRAGRGAPHVEPEVGVVAAPGSASMKCSFGIHDDCLYVDNCACPCHAREIEGRRLLEAEFLCRHLMTEVARIEVRGFDTARARAMKIAELDEALDNYNLYVALEG